MKTSLKPITLVLAVASLLIGCTKDHIVPEFEQENAAYTGQFNFKTKSQQFAVNSDSKNTLKVIIEGYGFIFLRRQRNVCR